MKCAAPWCTRDVHTPNSVCAECALAWCASSEWTRAREKPELLLRRAFDDWARRIDAEKRNEKGNP